MTGEQTNMHEDDLDTGGVELAANCVRCFLTHVAFGVKEVGESWNEMRGYVGDRLRMTGPSGGEGGASGGAPSNDLRYYVTRCV